MDKIPNRIEQLLRHTEVLTISTDLDENVAVQVCNTILSWQKQHRLDTRKEMTIAIHSAGGQAFAGHLIVDMMHMIEHPIATVILAYAGSGAALIAAAGTKGRRFATPESIIFLHNPFITSESPISGGVVDVEARVKTLRMIAEKQVDDLVRFTGQPREKIVQDLATTLTLTAEEARDYGVIDHILPWRKSKETSEVLIEVPKEERETEAFLEELKEGSEKLRESDPDLFTGAGEYDELEIDRRLEILRKASQDETAPDYLEEECRKLERFHEKRRRLRDEQT